MLFTGDLLQYRLARLSGPSSLFTGNMGQARESIRRLSTLDFDSLCFSHFPPLREEARFRMQRLAAGWSAAGD